MITVSNPPNGPMRPDVRRARLSAVVAAVTCVAAVGLVGFAWLPVSEVAGPRGRAVAGAIRSVTVQGWAFFTRDPQTAAITPYRLDGNTWQSAIRGPNAQPRYWLGLNRESRLTDFDVQSLTTQIEEEWWSTCDQADATSCFAADPTAHPVTVVTADPRLCGPVALVSEPPVPWAYRDLRDHMPADWVVLNVKCEAL